MHVHAFILILCIIMHIVITATTFTFYMYKASHLFNNLYMQNSCSYIERIPCKKSYDYFVGNELMFYYNCRELDAPSFFLWVPSYTILTRLAVSHAEICVIYIGLSVISVAFNFILCYGRSFFFVWAPIYKPTGITWQPPTTKTTTFI